MAERNTLVHQIIDWVERKPHEPAVCGKDAAGAWNKFSWASYYEHIRAVAKGLIALGVEPGACVAIVGNNRPEWVMCEFGMMAARAIPAPIYTTNTIEQVSYIVSHCRASVAICDNEEQLKKYRAGQSRGLMKVKTIITMDEIAGAGDDVISLPRLLEIGRQQDDRLLDQRIAAIDPRETCLLIYTSGTTGVPKAVQICHEGAVAIANSLTKAMPDLSSCRLVSYLPLCHIAEQIMTNAVPLAFGGTVYFCPDLKLLKDYLAEVRPTVFLGVPRVWEKFQAALQAKLGQAMGIKAKLAGWALRKELECFKESVERRAPYQPFGRKLANKLVISRIKTALGLDQLQVAATGAAPISVESLEFFASIGIRVCEAYGMSETTGVATISDPQYPVFGSVGRALDGVTIRIAEDEEILLKGKNMTAGYLHMPEESKELLDDQGWLHTGDLGSLDGEGMLRITGRKKDLLITAGGKNIAPTEIEAHLKNIPGVGQAVVIGDRQPYLCALLALDSEKLADLCLRLGINNGSVERVAADPKVRAFFSDQIESVCNSKLARYQTVKKFEVVPHEFTVDGGELTPTMKIKRNVVGEKYADLIGKMYQ
jgi:long-subunit acyl-CoA synthetase (AMP-forming)